MLWTLLIIALVGLDQWTKWFFCSNQAKFENFEVIKDFFYLTYLENRGAAFGILQNFRWVFIVLTIAALAALIWYFVRNRHPLIRTSLALIIAGAAGNFIDRLLNGYVVDFLHFYPFGYDFAIFNVADMCITVGVILLVIFILFFYKEPKKAEQKDSSKPADTGEIHGDD
jgi:signal peptidase II